jgi:hypothetical protein
MSKKLDVQGILTEARSDIECIGHGRQTVAV